MKFALTYQGTTRTVDYNDDDFEMNDREFQRAVSSISSVVRETWPERMFARSLTVIRTTSMNASTQEPPPVSPVGNVPYERTWELRQPVIQGQQAQAAYSDEESEVTF